VANDDSQLTGLDQGSDRGNSIAAEVAGRGTSASGQDPGWYNVGPNPNEQSYWDGQRWSGARHWIAGRGWIDGGGESSVHAPGGQAAQRVSANPYARGEVLTHARRVRSGAPAALNLGVLATIVAGIALMYGSVGTWVQISGSVGVIHFGASLNGIDQGITTLIGVNGYVTLIGGIVVLVFGALALSSEERLLVILTMVVSLAVLIFAIYDVFRTVQKIQALPASVQSHVSVGWGLICVLSAAVLTMIVTVARLLGQR
jgi:hypothetical protein